MDHNLEKNKNSADGVIYMHGGEGEETTVPENNNICFNVEVHLIVVHGDGD